MKTYDYKTFNFKTLNGGDVSIICFTFDTGRSWGHRAVNQSTGEQVKINYYNRTWEAFKYESVLNKAIYAMYPQEKRQRAQRAFIYKQVKAIARYEAEACEKWLKGFKKAYDALSDDTKKTLQKSDIFINSIEQGEAILKGAQLLDMLKA